MPTSGSQPGDFIDLDMDAFIIDRRQRLLDLAQAARSRLESELGEPLEIVNRADDFQFHDASGPRFSAELTADGRLLVTDLRMGNRL